MSYAILTPDGSAIHRVVMRPLPEGSTHESLGVAPVNESVPDGYTRTGWQLVDGVVEPVLVAIPPAPAYSRADYKAALDAMLLSECKRDGYDFDGIQTLAVYLFDPSNEFYPRAQWLARLNVFTWTTSNQLAAQPPAGDPPTPEQFAAYILGLFEASNPRPV
jgi:hypothetical protein